MNRCLDMSGALALVPGAKALGIDLFDHDAFATGDTWGAGRDVSGSVHGAAVSGHYDFIAQGVSISLGFSILNAWEFLAMSTLNQFNPPNSGNA